SKHQAKSKRFELVDRHRADSFQVMGMPALMQAAIDAATGSTRPTVPQVLPLAHELAIVSQLVAR
ncbi:MAG: hypothetical protein ABI386_05000, partial [Rhodanobacter sp.]